jgi:tetratricopeptide (TPR) repeat protein
MPKSNAWKNQGAANAQSILVIALVLLGAGTALWNWATPSAYDYFDSGYAKYEQGDLDGAIADYNKAIKLDPDDTTAYHNRGYTKHKQGDLSGAIADYTESIRLDPEDPDTYNNRSCLYYDLQQLDDALADFERAIALASDGNDSDNAQLYVWLIRARQGKRDEATAQLLAYTSARESDDPDEWYLQRTAFLAGSLSEAQFLSAANHEDTQTQNGQFCEAYFYASSVRLIDDDHEQAAAFFRKCVDTDRTDFYEYDSAQAQLKTIAQPDTVPAP